MKPETQRIAIAEACPQAIAMMKGAWVYAQHVAGMCAWHPCANNDPLNDLNAMHEAEKVLLPPQRLKYWTQIALHVPGIGLYPGEATAAQRAEAFLRTIGKWEESP